MDALVKESEQEIKLDLEQVDTTILSIRGISQYLWSDDHCLNW